MNFFLSKCLKDPVKQLHSRSRFHENNVKWLKMVKSAYKWHFSLFPCTKPIRRLLYKNMVNYSPQPHEQNMISLNLKTHLLRTK